MSELEQDVTFKTTKADLNLENVTNDRQMVGVSGEITPGNLLVFDTDGYHVKDSGISLDSIKELLKLIEVGE